MDVRDPVEVGVLSLLEGTERREEVEGKEGAAAGLLGSLRVLIICRMVLNNCPAL